MTVERVTIVDDGTPATLEAVVSDGRLVLAEDAARTLRGGSGPTDLAEIARALARPLAVDAGERAAYLGVGAAARGRALAALEAPDFTLPDLLGRPHRLADHRGRKVLLVAYSSW